MIVLILLFMLQSHIYFFRRNGKVRKADADGIVYGVGDGRRRRVDDDFADRFRTEGTVRLVAGRKFYADAA